MVDLLISVNLKTLYCSNCGSGGSIEEIHSDLMLLLGEENQPKYCFICNSCLDVYELAVELAPMGSLLGVDC